MLKKKDSTEQSLKKVSSAVQNMSALIDEIVKKARKNFQENGKTEVDAKFLKESVGALRELFDLLGEQNCLGNTDGIVIKTEKAIEEWNK